MRLRSDTHRSLHVTYYRGGVQVVRGKTRLTLTFGEAVDVANHLVDVVERNT